MHGLDRHPRSTAVAFPRKREQVAGSADPVRIAVAGGMVGAEQDHVRLDLVDELHCAVSRWSIRYIHGQALRIASSTG